MTLEIEMPQDFETEAGVLAGMLRHEKCLFEGMSRFRAEHFYDVTNQVIFATILRLAPKGRPTFKEVYVELKNEGFTDHLLNINKSIISEEQFPIWSDKLHELFIRRQYLLAVIQIAQISMDKNRNLEEVTDVVEKKILNVHTEENQDEIIEPMDAAERAYEEHEERLNSETKIHGIKISRERMVDGKVEFDGFPSLDKALMGIKGGDLIIVAAQSGEGKTALAQNIVRQASIFQNYRTYYQNTEMEEEEMVFRFVSQLARVEFEKVYLANYTGPNQEAELTRVRKAFDAFGKSNVFLSKLPLLSPQRSRGLARKFKLKYGKLDLLVIDYIGRMEVIEKGLREDQVLAMIAKESKKLAQELDCAVILISQLNEDGRIQGARRIINDADAAFFLERLTEEEKEKSPRKATHKLEKRKVRRGSKDGLIYLNFNKALMYMSEVQ